MCTGEQKQSRTPHSDRGRRGVWLEDKRFAEEGSFEYLLWLKSERMCHSLMSVLINLVQKVDHEGRARLALDFPDVVAALEAPDWYKAPHGREHTPGAIARFLAHARSQMDGGGAGCLRYAGFCPRCSAELLRGCRVCEELLPAAEAELEQQRARPEAALERESEEQIEQVLENVATWQRQAIAEKDSLVARVAELASGIEEALGHMEGAIGALDQVRSDLEKAKEGT